MSEYNVQALLGPDTCRLCLKAGRSPTPVSNENLEGSTMAIKIDILTSVKVAPSDKVCPMCRVNVRNFYDFRIMCLQSDARIRGFAAKAAQECPKFSDNDPRNGKVDKVVRMYKRKPVGDAGAGIKGFSQNTLFSKKTVKGGGLMFGNRLNYGRHGRHSGNLNITLTGRVGAKRSLNPSNPQIDLETEPGTVRATSSPTDEDADADAELKTNTEKDIEIKTEKECEEADFDDAKDTDSICEESNITEIKKELENYETTIEAEYGGPVKEEDTKDADTSCEEERNTIIKQEPDDCEAVSEPECDETKTRDGSSAAFCEVSVEGEDKELANDESENMEILVDPLIIMDEGSDSESKESCQLDGQPRMHVPLPSINGARSDEQRALDFVKQHMHGDDPVFSQHLTDLVEKPFKCTSCSGSFAYYKSFVKHRNRHSGVSTPYECPHCPENFKTSREMHFHFRRHAEKMFPCDRCYRSFPTRERLQSHYTLHTGNKPYSCDICKSMFAYKSSYAFHMRKQHGEEVFVGACVTCPKCPTEWNNPGELRQHMELHSSDEANSSSFRCEVCCMSFSSKSILNVHARIHQGLKPFK